MSKIDKRAGYQAPNIVTGSSSMIIPSGYIDLGTTTTASNWSTLTPPPYVGTGGYSYVYPFVPKTVEFEPIYPVAVKHTDSGKRLIIWEP